MLPTLASALALLLYCGSALLIYKQLGTAHHPRWIALTPATIAILLQATALSHQIVQPGGLNLGLLPSFALIACLISMQVLLSSMHRRIESLGIVAFPISGFAGLLADLPLTGRLVSASESMIQGHIMISVIAYSLITLGVLQAGLLAYQDRSIRRHQPWGFIRFLPSLNDMEILLFQFLGFGFLCLSASLVSGFLFMQDMFAQQQAHKVVFSVIAWMILGTVLVGRVRFGWRGQKAIRWTLVSFVFLVLAFIGSKVVYELILA